jgi:hypothetical protein
MNICYVIGTCEDRDNTCGYDGNDVFKFGYPYIIIYHICHKKIYKIKIYNTNQFAISLQNIGIFIGLLRRLRLSRGADKKNL